MLSEIERIRPRASHYGPDREQSVAFHQMAAGIPVRGFIRRIQRYVAEVTLVDPSGSLLHWEMGLKDLKHVRPPELWEGDRLTDFWQKRFTEKLENFTEEWLLLQSFKKELQKELQEIFACFKSDKSEFEKELQVYKKKSVDLHRSRGLRLISRDEFLNKSQKLLKKMPKNPDDLLLREIEYAVKKLTKRECHWEAILAFLGSLP